MALSRRPHPQVWVIDYGRRLIIFRAGSEHCDDLQGLVCDVLGEGSPLICTDDIATVSPRMRRVSDDTSLTLRFPSLEPRSWDSDGYRRCCGTVKRGWEV